MYAIRSYYAIVEESFRKEQCLFKQNELSAITLKLPESNVQVTGFYYHILKAIAWEGVNIKVEARGGAVGSVERSNPR